MVGSFVRTGLLGTLGAGRRPHAGEIAGFAEPASEVERQGGELRARGDAKLAEDVAQVEVDGAWADEQLRGDVAVGQPLAREGGDLAFLGGQLGGRGDVAAPG